MSSQKTSSAVVDSVSSVRVEGVSKKFGHGVRANHVLDSVSFTVEQGRSVGLVGESGSGKSTIAKIVCGMYRLDAGRLNITGTEITPGQRFPTAVQDAVSFISQNPFSSFNPRLSIGQSLTEALSPLTTRPAKHKQNIADWLERVGLPADSMRRFPHEFSGGQRQRLAIARGLIRRPAVVVADEITSALDMSVQVQVLKLLAELRREYSFSMLFISHDLSVVRTVCDDVIVMQRGSIVERGASHDVLTRPSHPYSQQLLDSIPGSPGFSLTD